MLVPLPHDDFSRLNEIQGVRNGERGTVRYRKGMSRMSLSFFQSIAGHIANTLWTCIQTTVMFALARAQRII